MDLFPIPRMELCRNEILGSVLYRVGYTPPKTMSKRHKHGAGHQELCFKIPKITLYPKL